MRYFLFIPLLFLVSCLVSCKFGEKTPDVAAGSENSAGAPPTPVATPTPKDDPPIAEKPSVSDIRLRLGNRFYVASVLENVFGPTAVGPAIDQLVRNQPNAFGGSCDSYIARDCGAASESQAPVIPNLTTSRAALITRVCARITINDDSVTYAVRQALSPSADPSARVPVSAELPQLFELFYLGETAPADVLTDLMGIVTESRRLGQPKIDSWRFVLQTLCLSGAWQIH